MPSALRFSVTLELVDASGRALSVVSGSVREEVFLWTYFDVHSDSLTSATKSRISVLARELAKSKITSRSVFGHADPSAPRALSSG